jgi:NitT/TauT family transport system substrate-binding protein
MVSDLGFNPYTSLLCAHDEMLSGNPGLAEKMVAASVRGWEKYVASPEETNQYIHRVNPEIDLDILAYGAGTIKPLVIDRESQQHRIGTMSRERWQELADQLVASGQLKKEDEHVNDAFSTKFLPVDQHP